MTAYADYDDAVRHQDALEDLSKLQIVQSLASTSRIMDGYLARLYDVPLVASASATITFDGTTSDDDELTIADIDYRFKDTPAQAYDVDIGATAAETAQNLQRAIEQSGIDSGYYTGTEINDHFSASISGAVVTVTARKGGPEGNDYALSTTSDDITLGTLSGGAGEYSQLLQVCVWLVTADRLTGQKRSRAGGGGSDLIEDQYEKALAWLEGLSDGSIMLFDDDGTKEGIASGKGIISSTDDTVPFADEGDPVYWAHDDDKDWADDRG